MTTAGTLEIDVVLNGKKVRLGLNDLRKRMGLLNKTANTTNKIFGRIARFASVGFMTKLALDTAKLNQELAFMSDTIGVSFENVTKTRRAFSAFGGDAKVVDRILSSIALRLAETSALGEGALSASLQALGINPKAGNRNKSPEEILIELSKYIQRGRAGQLGKNYSDAELFVAVRQALPEMDWSMYQFLAEEDVAAAIQKAPALTPEQERNTRELGKATSEFKTAAGSLQDAIVAENAQSLSSGLRSLTDFIYFLQNNFLKETAQLVDAFVAFAGYETLSAAITKLLSVFGVGSGKLSFGGILGGSFMSAFSALIADAKMVFDIGEDIAHINAGTGFSEHIKQRSWLNPSRWMYETLDKFFDSAISSRESHWRKIAEEENIYIPTYIKGEQDVYTYLLKKQKQKAVYDEIQSAKKTQEMIQLAKVVDEAEKTGIDFLLFKENGKQGVFFPNAPEGENLYFPDASEVFQFSPQGANSGNAIVNVTNNITQNPDNSFDIETTTDVNNGQFIQTDKVYGVTTGAQ